MIGVKCSARKPDFHVLDAQEDSRFLVLSALDEKSGFKNHTRR